MQLMQTFNPDILSIIELEFSCLVSNIALFAAGLSFILLVLVIPQSLLGWSSPYILVCRYCIPRLVLCCLKIEFRFHVRDFSIHLCIFLWLFETWFLSNIITVEIHIWLLIYLFIFFILFYFCNSFNEPPHLLHCYKLGCLCLGFCYQRTVVDFG